MARRRSTKRVRTRNRRQPGGEVHKLRRMFVQNINKVAADSGTYYRSILADFPGASDITSLFTDYKITKLRYTIRLVNAPNNNANFPTLYFAPQSYVYNGSSPSSASEVFQFKNLRTFQFGPSNLSTKLTVRPRVSVDVNNLVNSGIPMASPWLNTANNSVPHIGIVWWISRYNSTTDTTHQLELQVDAWISARNSR